MKMPKLIVPVILICALLTLNLNAQDAAAGAGETTLPNMLNLQLAEEMETQEKGSNVDIGTDLLSRYLWRGQLLAGGPVIQPFISYSNELGPVSIEVGAWGSYGFSESDGTEADLYATLGAGALSFSFTDYYFPSDAPFAGTNDRYLTFGPDTITGHVFEGMFSLDGFGKFPLSASLAYNLGGADLENSLYLELSFPFSDQLEAGLSFGNGWYSYEEEGDGDAFSLINVSISYAKEIGFTEEYSLPVFTTLALNPNLQKIYIVFGISFR